MKQVEQSARVLFALLLTVIIGLAYYYYLGSGSILPGHATSAGKIADGAIYSVFPGSYIMAASLSKLLSIPAYNATVIVGCIHIGLTFLALAYALHVLSPYPLQSHALVLLAFVLLFVAPIGLPGIDPKIYNYPYTNRSVLLWRNITHTVVQPYAIAAFCFFCLAVRHGLNETRYSIYTTLATGLLWFSTVVKPNFAYSFIPAMTLLALLMYHNQPQRLYLVAMMLLPSVLTGFMQIGIQLVDNPLRAAIREAYGGANHRVTFDPFTVWIRNNVNPAGAFLLAAAFPLYVGAWRRRVLSFPYKLAALNLIVASLTYAAINLHDDRNAEWGFWYGVQLFMLAGVMEWCRWIGAARGKGRGEWLSVAGAGLLLCGHIGFGGARLLRTVFPELGIP